MDVDGMPLSTYLDKQHVLQVILSLVKIRQSKGITRTVLAEKMGVPVQRIHDFDERKTPWQSISISFVMLYARSLDVRINLNIQEVPRPESEEDDGRVPDEA